MKTFLICLILALTSVAAFASDPVLDEQATLARVNDEPVTVKDLLVAFGSRHSGHSKFLGGDVEARKFLEIVIEDRLLVQEAYSLGIDEDPEVRRFVTDFEDAKLAEFFVGQEITSRAEVTDADVQQVWERNLGVVLHARQIVLATRAEAEEVRAALVRGADVEVLARACSLSDTRMRGGHVMATWGTFEPEWERVVFTLEPGEISPVIESAKGFEVVTVVNRVEASPAPLAKVEKEIRNTLSLRRLEARKTELSDELWRKYGVELKLSILSPRALAALLARAPETVVATWSEGGTLALREVFEKHELAALEGADPVAVSRSLAARIRQTVNAPLVIREARARKMEEAEPVVAEVSRYRDLVIASVLFRDHVFKKPEPGEAELQAYYESHKDQFEVGEKRRVAQILVPTKDEADAVYAQLVSGADFAEVAKKSSRDMVTAGSGGDLGWVPASGIPEAFERVASMQPGDLLKPVRTDSGWHVVKLLEIAPKTIPSFEEAREKVRTSAIDEQKRAARAFWIEKLRNASRIVVDDAAIAAFVKANEFSGQAPPQHVVQ
jgi:parvulin-like peptidyl-prolyl isomerase